MRLNFENEDIDSDEFTFVVSMYDEVDIYMNILEYNETDKTLDLVTYDISGLLECPQNSYQFNSIVEENLLDKEEMEINRTVIIKGY